MTNKQRDVLEYIKKYIDNYKYPPIVREISKGMGIKSTFTVHGYLNRLEETGDITRKRESPRSIRIK